jgi:hypothetical protein
VYYARVYSYTLVELEVSYISKIRPSRSANQYSTSRTSSGACQYRVVVEDEGEGDWMAPAACLAALLHIIITGFRPTHSQPKGSNACIALAE